MHKEDEVVWLVNSKPGILHLPDTVKREVVQTPLGQMDRVMALNDGIPLIPSAPREKDGEPQPTAVPKAYWDNVCKVNTQVQSWMKRGWVRVVESGAPGTESPDSLSKYNEATAVALVEGCKNHRLLNDWMTSEQRPRVRSVIEARLEVVTAPKAKR